MRIFLFKCPAFKIDDLRDPMGGGPIDENYDLVEKGRPRSLVSIASKRGFSAKARKMGKDSTLKTVTKRDERGIPPLEESLVSWN